METDTEPKSFAIGPVTITYDQLVILGLAFMTATLAVLYVQRRRAAAGTHRASVAHLERYRPEGDPALNGRPEVAVEVEE